MHGESKSGTKQRTLEGDSRVNNEVSIIACPPLNRLDCKLYEIKSEQRGTKQLYSGDLLRKVKLRHTQSHSEKVRPHCCKALIIFHPALFVHCDAVKSPVIR